MPDKGKRTGNAEMGGMRWQWEQEVTEMPLVEGLFRVDVRARPTGESVDDSREPDKSDAQTETKSEASGSETEKLAWTKTPGMPGAPGGDPKPKPTPTPDR